MKARIMESSTPETNNREWPIWPPVSSGEMFVVKSDFARTLEKERDEARDLAVRYRSMYYTALGISEGASWFSWEARKYQEKHKE